MRYWKRFKKGLIPLLSHITQIMLSSRGDIRFGEQCTLLGLPRLRMQRGSRITVGAGCTLLSCNRHNPLISSPIRLNTFSSHAHIELGERVGISGSHIACCEHIHIGDDSIIGPDCLIFDWKAHDYQEGKGWAHRKKIQGQPITIGKRCYIGARCIILKGVSIGDDCVISAGSLVNRSIPSKHRAYGNPLQIKSFKQNHTHTSQAKCT